MVKFSGVFVLWGLILGLSPSPARAEPGDPDKGKAIYERLCITCHGPQGKGDGPAGSMMMPHPADFTSPKIKGKPDSELAKSIKEGHPATTMAAFKGQLSDAQINDALTYVRGLGR